MTKVLIHIAAVILSCVQFWMRERDIYMLSNILRLTWRSVNGSSRDDREAITYFTNPRNSMT